MIDSLAAAITVACLGAAAWIGVRLAARRYRWRAVAPALAGLEAALVLQAVLAAVGLARGHHPREPGVHLAYLAVSVLVLPAAIGQARGDDGGWAAGLLLVSVLAVAVIVVRAQTTWRPV